MNSVLLVDDDDGYRDSFITFAEQYRFPYEISGVSSWEEAEALLIQRSGDFVLVILDGKGQRLVDSTANDPSHLHYAITRIKDLERRGIAFLYFVLTAYGAELKDYVSGNVEFVDKGIGSDKVLDYASELIQKHPDYVIVGTYPVVFEIFTKEYLDRSLRKDLVEILSNLESRDRRVLITCFKSVRTFIEQILRGLWFRGYLLDKLAESRVKFKESFSYLSGYQYQGESREAVANEFINRTLTYVYNVSTLLGTHEDTDKRFTASSYKSVVFGLLEILVWYKDLCDKKDY